VGKIDVFCTECDQISCTNPDAKQWQMEQSMALLLI
jgi:hypothetical protein